MFDVQYQLLAVAALCGEETGHFDLRSMLPPAATSPHPQPLGRNLALDHAGSSRFHLFRFVPDSTLGDRNPCRRIAQREAFDQAAGEFYAIQQTSGNSLGGSRRFNNGFGLAFHQHFDFSSFIIGDGK